MSPEPDVAAWPPGNCEEVCLWLNARLDGECTPAQEGWLAAHLQDCSACSGEWAALERTQLAFLTARLREPADFEREALERAFGPRLLLYSGWLLVGGGGLVLTAYGAFALFQAEDLPLPLRLGAAAAAAGTLLLLGRLGWERLRLRRRDPFRDVLR